MSLHHHPSLMAAGAGVVISPDGSHIMPPELWADYAAIVLLEPEPALLATWTRRLEVKLGVTDEHRRAIERAGGGRRAYAVSRRLVITHWFGLRQTEADLLDMLIEMRGAPCPAPTIAACFGITISAVWLRIHRLRQAMREEAIDSSPAGYSLTEVGLCEIAEASREIAASLSEDSLSVPESGARPCDDGSSRTGA